MRLDDEEESNNIEDLRGQGGGGFGLPGLGGGGGGLQFGGRSMGCGSLVIVIILALVFGINPMTLLSGGGGQVSAPTQQIGQPQYDQPARLTSENDRFVAKVLNNTERTWSEIFQREVGEAYREPKLALFTNPVPTACGAAESAMGPFYCPADQKVYLDQSFFDELARRFGAPGDFAAAYVIAHEVGHHIQTLLGISQQVSEMQNRVSRTEANALSVRLELQADCLAGVWAHHNQTLLEPGDVEEAMRAATAIGDDALQRAAQGVVVPESFTHGSSEQRTRWFMRGMTEGTIAACDTFRAREL
jgi:predicted metalloprotease